MTMNKCDLEETKRLFVSELLKAVENPGKIERVHRPLGGYLFHRKFYVSCVDTTEGEGFVSASIVIGYCPFSDQPRFQTVCNSHEFPELVDVWNKMKQLCTSKENEEKCQHILNALKSPPPEPIVEPKKPWWKFLTS